jgi:hypothetical protein
MRRPPPVQIGIVIPSITFCVRVQLDGDVQRFGLAGKYFNPDRPQPLLIEKRKPFAAYVNDLPNRLGRA